MYNYIMYSTVAMQCAIGSVKTLHVIVHVSKFWPILDAATYI